MNPYGINDGLQRRELVKSEIKEFLKTNKKITSLFSKKLYKKYGFSFSATAGLVREIKSN